MPKAPATPVSPAAPAAPASYEAALDELEQLVARIESGQLPDFRHNFVIKGEAIDALFAELGVVANALEANRVAA